MGNGREAHHEPSPAVQLRDCQLAASGHRKSTVRGSRFLGMIVAAFLASTASAAPLWCYGTITGVLLNGSGEVQVLTNFAADWRTVCSQEAPWKGISVDRCKGWYALAMAARLSGNPVTIYYGNPENYASCAAIPFYNSAPAPGYLALNP
jgi:hypothetical protein